MPHTGAWRVGLLLMLVLGTYRDTDVDRDHPLAALLADLLLSGQGQRLGLSGLDEDDVAAGEERALELALHAVLAHDLG